LSASSDQTANGLLTYAIGDIHGSLDKLDSLIRRCEEHAAGRPRTLLFLGDFIDRGADSAGVVRRLVTLQSEQPERIVTLMGNHEAMALGVLAGRLPPDLWLTQGGAETLDSYGVSQVRDLPREHLAFIRGLRLSHDDGRRFFVHAGIDPEKPLDAQDEADLLWIREPFLTDRGDYGRLIVHGHTPLESGLPDLRRNRLNLDTGAVFGGPLTAAVFDQEQERPIAYFQAK
jgi:serine/threonine protein phosphatase 1